MSARRPLLVLWLLGAFAAPALSKNAVLNVSNVTIVSMDAHSLVVSRSIKGKTEQLRFVVNSDTTLKGKLTPGSRVTVHYTTQYHENIATSIQSR